METDDSSLRFEASSRENWRKWLQAHHQTDRQIWLVLSRKGASRPSVTYDEAVEEAICFGWVDSIVRRIDEATYAQKFTPRKSGSTWSESNIERARRMMKEGKMTPAGREKLENRLPAPTEQLTADN